MARKSWFSLVRRLPARVWRILRSDKVSAADKLLFIAPVALYWILPDFMPFMPIDDLAFTAIAGGWYARAMERKYALRT
ncbi:hypothetical protein ACF3MZ_13785 [Paenibacillaceae bacterium WGS1546]|uniref:hypothetical protein n=1 Tax=Cohnella sp. WGS1546 TaxID=3366810 RepID=UPI00372D315D